MTDKRLESEMQEQEKVRKNLAQLVDKMYGEFSRSKNFEHGYQDYQNAEIHEHICADTSDAVAYSYSGRRFKLHCGGPHFRDTSESWDFAGLDAYDGKSRLNLEEHATYFAGYQTYGSIPYLKALNMKHLGERRYEIAAQIGSSKITYLVDFEKRKVEKQEKKVKK